MSPKILCQLAVFTVFLFGIFATKAVFSDFYISNYDPIDLDFVRTHYTEINNSRPIQFDAQFVSYKWLPIYEYQDRLALAGIDISHYNVLQMTLKENDDFHYCFPILLVPVEAGDLKEFDTLQVGEKVKIFGFFYNLKNSEFAVKMDLIETIQKGGHDRELLLDARQSPTPTETPTLTPTPGPSLWKRINAMINPTETVTPSPSPNS